MFGLNGNQRLNNAGGDATKCSLNWTLNSPQMEQIRNRNRNESHSNWRFRLLALRSCFAAVECFLSEIQIVFARLNKRLFRESWRVRECEWVRGMRPKQTKSWSVICLLLFVVVPFSLCCAVVVVAVAVADKCAKTKNKHINHKRVVGAGGVF